MRKNTYKFDQFISVCHFIHWVHSWHNT